MAQKICGGIKLSISFQHQNKCFRLRRIRNSGISRKKAQKAFAIPINYPFDHGGISAKISRNKDFVLHLNFGWKLGGVTRLNNKI